MQSKSLNEPPSQKSLLDNIAFTTGQRSTNKSDMVIGIDWGKIQPSRNYLAQAYGRSQRIIKEERNKEGRLHSLTGPAKIYTAYGEERKEHYIDGCYHTEVDFALHTAEKITQKLCLELLPKIQTKREYRAITRHLKKLGWNKKQRNRIPQLLDLADLFKRKEKQSAYYIDAPIFAKTSNWGNWDLAAGLVEQSKIIAKAFNCPVITATQQPKQIIYITKEIDPSECVKRFDQLAESQEK